jgi:two-component system, chemotaxis family, sensor kinase CheA
VSLDLKRYLSLYVAEAGEHLAAFEKDLVLLEKAARDGGGAAAALGDAIASCFRHAHSVKGMSASMQLDGITAVAHRAEDLVDVFRKDPTRLDAGTVDVLLDAADVLLDMVEAAATGANPPADAAMMERLSAAAKALRDGGTGEPGRGSTGSPRPGEEGSARPGEEGFSRPAETPPARPEPVEGRNGEPGRGSTSSPRPEATSSPRPEATSSPRPEATSSRRPGEEGSPRPAETPSVRPEPVEACPEPVERGRNGEPGRGSTGSPRPEEPVPAEPPRTSSHRVLAEVEVAGTCPVPAVRAFLVVKKLGTLGAVARTKPSVDELKAGRIPGRKLEVQLDTPETLQALERALAQISDLAGVVLRDLGEGPAPERSAPDAKEAERSAEASRSVRVRTELLDGFLDAVGELILGTARIREIGKGLPQETRAALDEGVDRLHATVKDLHDKVMAVRMTPLATMTDRLPRVAGGGARKLGKQVEVEVTGAQIEIDRAILEELTDPLLHVIRNAVDHGLEPSHLRLLAGKPAVGRLCVSARRERDRVILEISDDGKGMDPAKLRGAAVARGAVTPERAAALSDREALLLACLPGVSTADTVTDVSGRGVGLDAVKRTVEAVGGTIEIESAPGAGSRITFRLPLTVAVQPVLLVRVGEEVLGLPIAKVHGAAQVDLSRLDRSRGEPVLAYQGDLVPVHELTTLLGLPGGRVGESSVVVAEGADGRMGFAVDALLGQHEAVLKPLGSPLDAVPGLSAVTVLGNGRPVFILDMAKLLVA